MKPHPNTLRRNRQEQKGGWLPLYIEAEKSPVDGCTLRCYYCGFGFGCLGSQHDNACRYLGAHAPTRGDGAKRIQLVPKGGLPPSNSFF